MSLTMKHPELMTNHLVAIITSLKTRFPDQADEVFLAYGLATEVLRFYLGNEWVNMNVFPFDEVATAQVRSRRSCLRTESSEHKERFRHQDRVIQLGELLFNLCGVEGFNQKLEDLRNSDLVSIYAEFQCVRHIARCSVIFRFVIPLGVTGQDYDVEMLTTEGEPIPTELKSKAENTALSKRTILSSLDTARRQLPSGSLGVVFINVPEAWVANPEVTKLVSQALDEFFRNTMRVVAVVFRWEEWIFLRTGQSVILTKFRVVRNKVTLLASRPSISAILDQLEHPSGVEWTDFLDLVSQHV